MAYEKQTWVNDETVISAERMNHMGEGIEAATNGTVGPAGPAGPQGEKGDTGPQGPAGKDAVLTPATTEAIGAVKMAAAVADASGETVTKEEYNGLLSSLRAAGIVSPT